MIAKEEEGEHLLDAIDAAEAKRIAGDASDPVLTWDEVKDDFIKNRIVEVRAQEPPGTQPDVVRARETPAPTLPPQSLPLGQLTRGI